MLQKLRIEAFQKVFLLLSHEPPHGVVEPRVPALAIVLTELLEILLKEVR